MWSWQLYSQKTGSSDVKETYHVNFTQAGTKLLMVSEVPAGGAQAETPGQIQSEDAAGQKDLPPSSPEMKKDQVVVPPPVAPAPIPWCGISTSFNTPVSAEKFASEWLRAGGTAEKELIKEPGTSTWWVYLPASRDEGAISLVLKQLHEKQIDSYYMRTGELAGSISLGVFSRKVSASAVQQTLRNKGYSAEIKEIQRMDTKTQVILKLNDRKSFDGPVVKGMLGKYGSTQVKEIVCK